METPQFWNLSPPDYTSDYDHSLINGSLVHPLAIPGVNCSVCGETWGGSRILPVTCPHTISERRELTSPTPISLEAYQALHELVLLELAGSGVELKKLFPGDSFQPCYLDVPSRPASHFLWSSLRSVVVSQHVKSLLDESDLNDVAFAEVIMRRVGKRQARFPATVPASGEPEDLINESPLCNDLADVGRYYEMILLKESGYPPGATLKSICSGCGRPNVDIEHRRIVMTPEMWREDSIFFLATTLYVIVTDQVKKLLEKISPTNVVFTAI